MSREIFVAFGEALYGPQWQREMARALNVNERTVRRWFAGDFEIPATILPELKELARQRVAKLKSLINYSDAERTRS